MNTEDMKAIREEKKFRKLFQAEEDKSFPQRETKTTKRMNQVKSGE